MIVNGWIPSSDANSAKQIPPKTLYRIKPREDNPLKIVEGEKNVFLRGTDTGINVPSLHNNF